MKRVQFRERGIYRLSDGREFIAYEATQGEYSLFTAEAWREGTNAEYLINAEGHILSKGVPTKWSAKDLSDTGDTDGLRGIAAAAVDHPC